MRDAFKEDFQSELDPLDGQIADFDWGELYDRLGESAQTETELNRLAKAIAVIVRWIVDCSPSSRSMDRAIGRRAIALAWVLSPAYLSGSPSLRELARHLGVSAQVLSTITSSVSRTFGIRNRAQAHGWNWESDAAQLANREGAGEKRTKSSRRPRLRRADK